MALSLTLASAPVIAAETTRVSVSSAGAQGNNASDSAELSGDGRYAAFVSEATNLVANDVNDFADIFRHDRDTGATVLVSVSSQGVAADRQSAEPDLSADGSRVVFSSPAGNLVGNDTNGIEDIFLHELPAGTTSIVSVSSTGVRGNNSSFNPAISADGNVVAFASDANNLVNGDNNGARDVFVHDLSAGTTTRVSVSSAGTEANAESFQPALSADGRFVAFQSLASNLVAGDGNGVSDIFVHDTQSGETARVSLASSGAEANGASEAATISADGRVVAFQSAASNLVTGDSNGVQDVFARNLQADTTELLSLSSAGALADGDSFAPSVSADGVLVAFHSRGTNLVSGDSNGVLDVFLRDRGQNRTTRLSLSSNDTQGNGASRAASVSESGRFVAFDSIATNLVSGDTNGLEDVFVRDTQTSIVPTTLVSSILPVGRAVEIGVQATVFATVTNSGTSDALDCGIDLVDDALGSFFYQTTDPQTNQPTGNPNTPVAIPAGQFQTFVLSLTPMMELQSVDVEFVYDCANSEAAPIVSGLNTLLLSASATPGPDAVAIAATLSNDGVVRLPGAPSANAFSVAAVNAGAAGNVSASVDTGDAELPLALFICETNLQGECQAPPAPAVTRFLDADATATYSVFVNADEEVPSDFAGNRVFVRFADDNGVIVGATSVAVTTQ